MSFFTSTPPLFDKFCRPVLFLVVELTHAGLSGAAAFAPAALFRFRHEKFDVQIHVGGAAVLPRRPRVVVTAGGGVVRGRRRGRRGG